MTEFLQFALLGLGAGAAYTLVALGLVLVYRASGVINFSHGAMAMVGGFVFYELNQTHHWAFATALGGSAVAIALLGILIFHGVVRPLRRSSPLTQVVATLGVLTILEAAATIRYKATVFSVESVFPSVPHQVGSIIVPEDRLWLTGITVVVTAALWAGSRFLRVGLATTAVAENEEAAAGLGWSPALISTVNWGLGGVLAAAAAVLIMPLSGLSVATMSALLIPALAVALAAGFSSFSVVLIAGLALGVAQSEMTRYAASVQGAQEALPFVAIIAILSIRGTAVPLRGHLLDRLPRLGAGGLRLRSVAPVAACGVAFTLLVSQEWQQALGTSFIVAIMLLSIVVVTGYAGQVSLAQYAIGGIGALAAGHLVADSGWPFPAAIVFGVAAAALAGACLAIPIVRARGITLAIATLGLGYAIQQAVFNNGSLTGSAAGLTVGPQEVFGVSVDPVLKPGNYAVLSLLFLLGCSWVVCNIRRGRAGRRLIAVRANERAAAALGISVAGAKVYAFCVASALAGLGGTLLAFQDYSILYSQTFDPLNSITAVTLAVLGGVGFVLGPLMGSTLAEGGFPGGLISNQFGDGAQWLVLIGGVFVVVTLLLNPNGIAFANVRFTTAIRRRLARGVGNEGDQSGDSADARPRVAERDTVRVGRADLEVDGLTVRFGGVVAVDDVGLRVAAGEVVGLIGPNGAGKTTVMDAVSGFVRGSSGRVTLDGVAIDSWAPHRRARAGLHRSWQSSELFEDLTVADNLLVAADRRDSWAYVADLVRPQNPTLSGVAGAAIREFGLADDLSRQADELAYGTRRLVAIARAVASETRVLLLDEPTAGLGRRHTAHIGTLIRRMADEWGLAILLVEHDVSLVMSTCDRIVVLDFGKKISEGTPAEVAADPLVQAAYLGEATDSTRSVSSSY
jgi:ABC-type branched-subunit amino acid transport system ATPase component/branched-subunit amino acid ABC-type transport system permease component